MRLIEHIRNQSHHLSPQPAGEEPVLRALPGIRAIVFDIYGTLFISGSGDISLARAENRSPAVAAALATAGYKVLQAEADWSGSLLALIERFRADRGREGIEFPEVRIEEVWSALAGEATAAGWLRGDGDIELAIVDHECRVNPAWPMPGLGETLAGLRQAGLPMGIVSNAQFYTPLLFSALMGGSIDELGFDPGLQVWSYLEREGKPSTALYRKLKYKLESASISAEQCLYVGNDIRNDIWPAGELGFRTALFAGDARSLRRRAEDPDCRDVRPDLVLTDLRQLLEVIG
jgi:putative hydrolase of the HAD superfamily